MNLLMQSTKQNILIGAELELYTKNLMVLKVMNQRDATQLCQTVRSVILILWSNVKYL